MPEIIEVGRTGQLADGRRLITEHQRLRTESATGAVIEIIGVHHVLATGVRRYGEVLASHRGGGGAHPKRVDDLDKGPTDKLQTIGVVSRAIPESVQLIVDAEVRAVKGELEAADDPVGSGGTVVIERGQYVIDEESTKVVRVELTVGVEGHHDVLASAGGGNIVLHRYQ